jgi:hypothetical protein
MHINFDARVKVIKSGPLSILGRERGPDLIPRRSPERPPEVGADITPMNCDRAVEALELFSICCRFAPGFFKQTCIRAWKSLSG